jgi:hypothetical protein
MRTPEQRVAGYPLHQIRPNPLPRVSQKNHTSNATEVCVLNANEEKLSIVASAPYHGLCVGSDVTDGALLRGSSREPVSGASAEIVCSRRAVDCAARPKCRRRNCRDWGYCYSSLASIRRPIFGGTSAARRDHRPPTTSKRRLGSRLILFREMEHESPQQVCHNRCYIVTRTKCELERTYEKGASLMRAGRLRRRRLRTLGLNVGCENRTSLPPYRRAR